MQDIHARARRIRLAIFDVDGVLTDGALVYSGAAEETKLFNVRDGQRIGPLQYTGVAPVIITCGASSALEARMRGLGVDLLFQGAQEKLPAFNQLLERQGVAADAASFIGDDLQDLPLLRR